MNKLKFTSFLLILYKKGEMMGYFNLAELMPNENNLRNYFRYGGSLTSPPCTSGLIWTVFDHKIPISHNQVSLTLNLILNAQFILCNT